MYGFTYAAPPRVVVMRGATAEAMEAQAEAAEAMAIASRPRRLGWPAMILVGGLALMFLGKKG